MDTIAVNPLEEFKAELSYIESDLHKEILLRAMQFIPNYFWVVPASTSGRYHPKTSLGEGGLVRHSKAVFRIGQELMAHPMWQSKLTAEERDEIRIALLLHDTQKQGSTDEDAGTYAGDHPVLVREGLYPGKDGNDVPESMEAAWCRICDMIDTHMGPWNTLKDGTVFAGVPENNQQMFVHMCDYLASRRGIEVEGLDEYKPDWKQDLASEAQVKYIESLISKCSKADINSMNLPKIYRDDKKLILKKGEASAAIGMLKAKLS